MAQDIRGPFQSRDENDDEVRSLGDLIDARENPTQDDIVLGELADDDLDIEDALTSPHKKRHHAREVPDPSGFDADARMSGPADDEDDEELMNEDLQDDEDGGRIPTTTPDIDTRDEALDATRQIR